MWKARFARLNALISLSMLPGLGTHASDLTAPGGLIQDLRPRSFYQEIVREIGFRAGDPLPATQVTQILQKLMAYLPSDQVAYEVLLNTLRLEGRWIPSDSAAWVIHWAQKSLFPGGAKTGLQEQMHILAAFLHPSYDLGVVRQATESLQNGLGLAGDSIFSYPARQVQKAAFIAVWEEYLRGVQNPKSPALAILYKVFEKASAQELKTHSAHVNDLIPGLSAALLQTVRLPTAELRKLLVPIAVIARKSGALQREWIRILIQFRLLDLREKLMRKQDLTNGEDFFFREAIDIFEKYFPIQEEAQAFMISLVEDRVVAPAKANTLKKRILDSRWSAMQEMAPQECDQMLGKFKN